MGDAPIHAFHRRVFVAAIAVHTMAAWNSSGYYAADEHYQVIEFAQARLGELPTSDLAWEYDAHIRSALLPSICFIVFKAAHAVGVHNPFHVAFLLRALTSIVALLIVRRFVKSASPLVDDRFHRAFILLSYFLWFVPYQHVRFASETWAGLLFLVGLSTFIASTVGNRAWFVTGLAFGFCVLLKPVMLVPCGSAMAWSLVHRAEHRTRVLRVLTGGTTALLIGVLVDSWFYGDFTLTLWNYLHRNTLSITMIDRVPVVLEPYPWYYYFPWIIKYGIRPIGVVLVAGFFWLTYRSPRSLLVWCIWPYLIVLSAIPHKELRFLFPLVDLAPLVLVLAWQESGTTFSAPRGSLRKVLVSCAGLMVLLNATGLVVAGTTAAGSGRTALARAIRRLPDHPATLGYSLHQPEIWQIRIPKFYLPDELEDKGFSDPCWTPSVLSGPEATTLLIARENDPSGSGCVPEYGGYKRIGGSEGGWASEVLNLYNSGRHGPFVLYRLDPAPSHPSEP